MSSVSVSPYNPVQQAGVRAHNPPDLLQIFSAPTTSQYSFLGDIRVIAAPTAAAYMFFGVSGGNGIWKSISAGSSAVQTLTADDATTATPSSGTVTVSGGSTGLTTTASGSTLSLTGMLAVTNGGTGAATLTDHGVLVGQGTSAVTALAVGTNGQVMLGSTTADPAFGTLTTSTGIAFTTGAHTLAINVKSGGFAVTPVAGASQALAVQTTFIANDSALTTFTLPAASAVGDIINVIGSSLNTGGWQITYGAGQIIWGSAGSSTVTTGNAATGAAAAQTCSLICTIANTTWVIFANSGTITLT